MTREILFKAVSFDGKWVEGDLINEQLLGKSWIYNDRFEIVTLLPGSQYISRLTLIEVHQDTVCQYSGVLDNDGKKIFEGDIVVANGVRSKLVKDNTAARRYVSNTFADEYEYIEGRYEFYCYFNETFKSFGFKSDSGDTAGIHCNVGKRDYVLTGRNIHDDKLK